MSTTHVFWSNWLTRCIPLPLLFLENTSSSLWDIWKYYMFLCMLCKNFHLQLDNWTCQNLRNEAFTQRRKSQVKSLPCLSTSPHPAPLSLPDSVHPAVVDLDPQQEEVRKLRSCLLLWRKRLLQLPPRINRRLKTHIWRKPTVFACDGSETHKTCFA